MPSPLGHAMAGAMTAWVAETWARRSSRAPGRPATASFERSASGHAERVSAWEHASFAPNGSLVNRSLAAAADLASPLAVACAALAVLPDFDVFLHTHRTYSHSLGAAVIVWGLVALVAWRLRLPVVKTATVCAAAYASHVLLDWLGRDDSRLAGPMALWPLTAAHFKSGLDLFMEFTLVHRRFDPLAVLAQNARALAREVSILGPLFLVVMTLRLEMGKRTNREASSREARDVSDVSRLRAPVTPEEPG